MRNTKTLNNGYGKNFAGEKIAKAAKNSVGLKSAETGVGGKTDADGAMIVGGADTRDDIKQNHKNRITRYIPAELHRVTLSQYNNRCAYPNCNRPHDLYTSYISINQALL